MTKAPTWQAVRDHLMREKDRIVAEIRGYPPPIAGCDAQYQFLTERRHLIAQELVRLEAAQQGGAAALDDFIASSAFIDAAPVRRIRTGAGEG
ncbi:MAG: hypothetical protein HYW28_12675 [Rhodospirillales bacterium]|nr:hypothetical protein [Rhodospirillales bacterium]MBI2977923.1 hypothetical protein [Rhodospirillales bacterium]